MGPVIRNYVAAARVEHRRIVMFSGDGHVLHATDPAHPAIGIVDCPGGANAGTRVDVVRFGFADVEFGGAVERGRAFTAGPDGKAHAAVPVADSDTFIAGRAEVTTIAGDFCRCLVVPGVLRG